MTDNELNELKEIRDNAPVCSTHIETLASSNIYYLKRFNQYGVFGYKFWSTDHDCWVDSGDCTGNIRSLSDINTIIQLEQQKRELESQIEFKIKECMELAQACNRWKNSALTQKGLTNEDN